MKNKIALVLEGGGFRGCYTAGALTWLYEHGYMFDYTVSISATANNVVKKNFPIVVFSNNPTFNT